MTKRLCILLAALTGMAAAYLQAAIPTGPSTTSQAATPTARGGRGGRVGGGAATPIVPITPSTPIRLNTVGYLPDAPKKANFNAPPAPATPPTSFTLLHLPDKSKILSGPITGPIDSPENAEKIYTADFSTLNTPGEYLLDIPGVGQSPPFKIAPDILDQPFYLVTRAMYLFRCGIAIKAELNGHTFEHAACHTDDAWLDLITGQHTKKPSTGGWHDAGDYNKYVVNAGISVGQMLRAWEDFPNIHSFKLDIPESGGKIPDFLAEVKYETDWLLTMQADDGSVYTKLTTMNFGGFNMPEKETAPRFFVPTGSAATADFVAMLAMMARNIRPYDPAYADQCLAAAKKSYNWLTAHPADLRYNHAGTTTGGYDTSDPDDRLWAAAELWQTIGDPAFLKDLEARIRANQNTFNLDFDWANVKNLALYTYTLSTREGRDPQLLASLRQNLTTTADTIVQNAKSHAYNRPLAQRYYWGCNGGVARQAMTLMAANRLSPKPEYRNTTLDAINHLFGRNLYGRSFVTGLGYLPPLHPHHRPSGADNFPWPGQLVGGAQRGNDWQDNQDTYNVNEVAINWNTALIYALAPFVAQ